LRLQGRSRHYRLWSFLKILVGYCDGFSLYDLSW